MPCESNMTRFTKDILYNGLDQVLQLVQVDQIFLVEATVTHKGMRKPLIWERLKFTERFSFLNATKVDHVVVDDL